MSRNLTAVEEVATTVFSRLLWAILYYLLLMKLWWIFL